MSAYSFTKLFSSITESTIWCEPSGTRLVWITMLAKCDRHGCIQASVPGFARLANVTLAECEEALRVLLSPDPYSRTPDNDGRRLEVIDGGWRLLNHAKYRDMRDDDERREQNRIAQKRHRERVSKDADEVSKSADGKPPVSNVPPKSAHADADANSDGKLKAGAVRASRLPPDWQPDERLMAYARTKRPDLILADEIENFRDYWHAKAGKDASKTDWPATFRMWIRKSNQGNSHGSSRHSGSGRNRSAIERVQDRIAERERGREPIEGELVRRTG